MGVVCPFDPRFLKYACSARRSILLTAFLDALTVLVVIAQALLISHSVSSIIEGHAALVDVLWLITLLAPLTPLRGLLVATHETAAQHGVNHTICDLRVEVLNAAQALSSRWRTIHASETTTLLTHDLDDLGPYFVKFLPQLVLTSMVTPLALLVMALLDPWSALIAFLAIPLTPIFMILIGRFTQDSSKAKLAATERFSAQLFDLMVGLPTPRGLDREKGPRKHLEALRRENTRTTMSTLCVAFLSGTALEFLATLSVAFTVVEVGMRFAIEGTDLTSGLVVVMLAPEVFEPLCQVGAQFHTSANGVTAAQAVFDITEALRPNQAEGTLLASDPRHTMIELKGVSVAARDTWAPHRLNARIEPASFTVLVGRSGPGKTTSVLTILRPFKATCDSIVLIPEDGPALDLHDVNLASWWESITWVPQAPTLVPGTILDNLSRLDADDLLIDAARITGFLTVVESQTTGWDTAIGAGGVGLSLRRRQRLALTYALLEDAPPVVLDEPTMCLGAASEDEVIHVIQALRAQGKTPLVIAYRRSLISITDHVINIEVETTSAKELEKYPEPLGDTLPEEIIDIEMSGALADLTTHTSSTDVRREHV